MSGFITRWSGVLCAINFVVALIMVDAQGGFRQAFPAAILIMFGSILPRAERANIQPTPMSGPTLIDLRYRHGL